MDKTTSLGTAENSTNNNSQPLWCRKIGHLAVCYFLFMLLIIVGISFWNSFCNQYFCNGAHCYFRENRWNDIRECVLKGPWWEEAVFRLLPFLVASLALAYTKQRGWKVILCFFFGLLILGIQAYFGYLHYNPVFAEVNPDSYSVVQPLIVQGGTGLLFAVTYGVVLFFAYRVLISRQKVPNRGRALLFAHVLAYLSSTFVHMSSNLIMILTETF